MQEKIAIASFVKKVKRIDNNKYCDRI